MPLDLHDRSAPQSVFNAGISVDNMSWWFWVKAGMGFTLGAGIVAVTAMFVWTVILLGGLATLSRLAIR